MTQAAKAANAQRRDAFLAELEVTPQQWRSLRSRLQSAYHRCTNPNAQGYSNYGGRGIEFRFNSAATAAEALIRKLGPPPPNLELDRCDNDGPYSLDNIRYADRSAQANNKRTYRRSKTGERIRHIQQQRPDYHYESIRYLINHGLTDDQIIQKEKHQHVATHLRHS